MDSKQAVLIRTHSAGVHFGYLAERNGKEVVLDNARRIWWWKGANTLNEIAVHGVDKGSKVSDRVPSIVLTGAIEVLRCTSDAVANLEAATWG